MVAVAMELVWLKLAGAPRLVAEDGDTANMAYMADKERVLNFGRGRTRQSQDTNVSKPGKGSLLAQQ